MQGVPKGLAATIPLSMKYDHVTAHDTLGLDISATATARTVIMEANTPYSPFYSSASPFARSTTSRNATFSKNMRDLYQKCVVINSEIRVDFYNTGSTTANYLQVGITPLGYTDVDAGAGGPWTFTDPSGQSALERYGTIYTPSRPGSVKSLVTSIAPHKFLGRKDPLSDDTLHVASEDNGTTATDGRVFWAIWAAQVDPSTASDPAVCYAIVTTRLTIVWFEPKEHTRTTD